MPPSSPIRDRVFSRNFADPEVTAALDSMTIEGVIRALAGPDDDGEPEVLTRYADGQGYWKVGDGRPALADDDPAVMQAIGRCASWKVREKLHSAVAIPPSIHPKPCAWCEYPVAEMLRACDWSVWHSRLIDSEILTWRNAHLAYRRSGRDGEYTNPAYLAFWSLPSTTRQARIRAAQYPEEATR